MTIQKTEKNNKNKHYNKTGDKEIQDKTEGFQKMTSGARFQVSVSNLPIGENCCAAHNKFFYDT